MTTQAKILNIRSGISEKSEKKTPYVILQVQEEDGTSYNLPIFGADNFNRFKDVKPGTVITLKTAIDFRFNGAIVVATA